MIKVFLIAMMLVGSVSVQADKAGNGGDVLVCRDPDGKISSVELLDYYEAKERKIPLDLGPSDLKFEEKIEVALKRLERLSPSRAALYRMWYSKFFYEAKIENNMVLEDIDDSKHIWKPAGCVVEQIAVQREVKFPEDKRYYINKDLWDLLDSTNQAGLVLHEIVFREELVRAGSGEASSGNVRYFNSYIASPKLDSMMESDFLELLMRVKFNFVEIGGIPFMIECIKAYQGYDYSVCRVSQSLSHQFPIYLGGQFIYGASIKAYYPSGKPEVIASFAYFNLYKIQNREIMIAPDDMEFYESGHLKSAKIEKPAKLRTVDGDEVVFKMRHRVNFREDGLAFKNK